jgi:hypothetical protein
LIRHDVISRKKCFLHALKYAIHDHSLEDNERGVSSQKCNFGRIPDGKPITQKYKFEGKQTKSEDAEFARASDCLRPAGNAEFAVDIAGVLLDRVQSNNQFFRDFAVGATLINQAEHV